MQRKRRKKIFSKNVSRTFLFSCILFADSDPKRQLKSELNAGGESKLKRSAIPRQKQSSSVAKWNTVRGSRLSLFNFDFS